MDGLRLWVTTLLEYDKYGNAKVLRSFSKVAKDSNIQEQKKQVKGLKKKKNKKVGETELW